MVSIPERARVPYHEGRKLRICSEQGKPAEGRFVTITDAETGELVSNIKRIVIFLDARSVSQAYVTYHEVDEHGHIVKDDECGIVEKTVSTRVVEFDVLAYETGQEQQA